MKHILARRHRPALARFAGAKVLVGLDFDGTLAPIMLDPRRVRLPPTTRKLVREVAALYPTAVISGRARNDVTGRLRGLPLYEVVGNHGLEPPALVRVSGGNRHNRPRDRRSQVAHWIPRLHRDLDEQQGVEIEDKGLSVAVHFRRSHQKKRALGAITKSVAQLGRLRVLGGKQVVNLLPDGAPHKGLALWALVRRARCDRAIYLGDDDTDEDVFALDRPEHLLAIRVGRASRARSQAPYYLRHRGEVEIFLRVLRDLRAGRSNRTA